MGGAYELQLISRYFGGRNVLQSLAGFSKLSEDANSSVTASGHHAHHHQLHAQKVQPAQPKNNSPTDEELMQVLFNKLQSTKFQGPTHQGGVQPGH